MNGARSNPNTFHHSTFRDLQQLVAVKRAKGLSISLCIPTLNEETTIGHIVSVFRSTLMEEHALIDEIAVIDSGSTDRTREIATSEGADVYLAESILPELGVSRGKGENLWKSLHQLRGDIFCFVDGDIRNMHPRFVYGLVGPLLMNDKVAYVKAFYDRTHRILDGEKPTGGGRVTEVLIRPLFSLFYPQLCGIFQPLAGEYAARRSVLERLSFPTGYGVETAHLLDIYRLYGMEALAQTDLDERIHRHRSNTELGRMAFGILQVFFRRLSQVHALDIEG
ncbi:MAG: glucosyl-3-phosphoglycerate synthase, partial [Chthoniobacterales bacterium]